MCNQNTEFLNAQWVISQNDLKNKDMYSHFLNICENNNIKDVKERIDEMIILDFLIGNEDRHRGNFGILRNADDLQWISVVPVFDNGNSLFFDRDNEELENSGIDSLGKAFGDSNRLNLQLINYPEWYNSNKGKQIPDIVYDELKRNEHMLPARLDAIMHITRDRLKVFEDTINRKLAK